MDLTHYRPNVGIVLVRQDGKVWLGRRAGAPAPHNWQFPQGGMDAGETPYQAALRELREETGASSVSLLGQTQDWIAYAFPPGHGGSKATAGWLGQKQLWFALRFEGEDREIDLGAHLEVEFDAWRWAELAEALNLVVPFKRDTYRKVVDAFGPLIRAAATSAG